MFITANQLVVLGNIICMYAKTHVQNAVSVLWIICGSNILDLHKLYG